MKPYGVPRDPELVFPDVQTIHQYGLASRWGHLPGLSGVRRAIQHSANKRKSRRLWKKLARRINKMVALDYEG
jgi:hypothetical protein